MVDDPSNDLPRRATRAELEARLARAEAALRDILAVIERLQRAEAALRDILAVIERERVADRMTGRVQEIAGGYFITN